MSRRNHVARGRVLREDRQFSAQQRRIERSERGSKAQVKVLDKRLGQGQGATRERARLEAAL